MDLNTLVALLGFSDTHAPLQALLASSGPGARQLSKRKLRAQGVVGMELFALGLALTFQEREGYERKTAPARDQEGDAILAAIFAYSPGNKNYQSYTGPIPFTDEPTIRNREDALRAFGPPARTEVDENDGSIDWDQWLKDGFQLRTTYRSDGALRVLSLSRPFKS